MTSTVETGTGKVRGTEIGRTTIFKGISYGAPTLGNGRFRPPRKAEAWGGVRETLAFGNACYQDTNASQLDPATISGKLFSSDDTVLREGEDCLVARFI